MKIALVHNAYGRFSGEEAVVENTLEVLRARGHEVSTFFKSSRGLRESLTGKVRAFFSGIYSLRARREMGRLLREEKPDIVQVQNVYPLISPSVLPECRRRGVPVVMRVPNYRLLCPHGLLMTRGRVCERCRGGGEHWCVLKNCEGSLPKSLGYALRNWFARKTRLFQDNVTLYYALTEFQRNLMAEAGFPPERIQIIPNMTEPVSSGKPGVGSYVAYAGRISPEKGLLDLVKAASELDGVPLRAAGGYQRMPELPSRAPHNVEFLGHLEHDRLDEFYRGARMLVIPSVWYEGLPNTLLEGMMRGLPAVCSRIGGLGEVVDEGRTGLLFEPGNAGDLADKIRCLWNSPERCRKMGAAARRKALREYSPERYYERLVDVYEKAIELGPGGPRYAGYHVPPDRKKEGREPSQRARCF